MHLSANDIVNEAIKVSGGSVIDTSVIRFNFRDKSYLAKRQKGQFKLTRKFEDSLGSIEDVLDNNSFRRFINNKELSLSDSLSPLYKSSVNSVHYFSVLPYGLNDEAVLKEYVGKELIEGEEHYKIKVTFKPEGGGEDYEDIFIYWFEIESFKLNYLAYSYNEDDDIGLRFRQAFNERYVNSVRFVDYYNFKPKDDTNSLTDLAVAFEQDQLEQVSKIELTNVMVGSVYNE
ncbi:MAG: deoxyribose-phosphate aldolase [Winogradskyella sp.]|nr:deoxyribose-phosphate aldolase [Winogradskyella sp.]MBT8375826.1 deoxyribose-phosphate aldolase [Bacteroidia bacterium]NNC45185.1 deoxyribose-phosphate aldolase [Winogradskyella sp.]NNF84953.1 deoxyribose-phosphate aldolase [Winogradskyella sp.]NNL82034.1 deoxyribose-phosphate aldolase [Winogradskyella sp.]